jgi:hypothetical protein
MNIDETLSTLHEVISKCDDYEVTNINGLINIALDNPELFKTLIQIIQAEKLTALDLSIYCSERIEELGL